jgi:hypothetical protein
MPCERHEALREDDMISQAAVSGQASPTSASPCWERESDVLEAAFISANDAPVGRNPIGYVDCRGDVYDSGDRRVGHVTAAVEDVGEIYHGYDDKLGYVRVTPNGDGYIYTYTNVQTTGLHEPLLRGVVTARGEIYRGRCARKVGTAKPPLDAERMGAAALLLGLL